MTDTNGFLQNPSGITSDLLYNLKPSAVASRTYRCSVPTSNKSSFSPLDQAIAYIPARRNCFLDTSQSYLRMTIQNNESTAANYFTLDSCGACVINRLDIFSGSNLLETVQGYNILYNYLLDSQLTVAQRSALSATYGTTGNIGGTSFAARNGAIIGAGNKLTTCMPLLSGLVGVLAEKYLPLSLADDIRLEFSIEANNVAVAYAASQTTNWTITNMELELCIIEMSSEGMQMIESVSPFSQPVYLHSSSYRHFTANLPTQQTGQITHLVPARFASLRSIHVLPRRSTEVTGLTSFSLSSRINPLIESYQFRIGSLLVPQKMVNLKSSGYAEGFMENQRSWHSVSHPEYAGSCGSWCYNICDVQDLTVGDGSQTSSNKYNTVQGPFTGANSYQNGFSISQELEVFSNKSDTILQGVNTLGSQVFWEGIINGTVNSGNGVSASYIFDYYALFDCVFIIQDGLISVKF